MADLHRHVIAFLEGRRTAELAELIQRHNGVPLAAPCLREVHQPEAPSLQAEIAQVLDKDLGAQDRPAAHIDATVSQDASDAFSRGAQLQVVADGQQNDVTWEAMASHQARRFDRGVPATNTAGVNGTAALIVAIAGQV